MKVLTDKELAKMVKDKEIDWRQFRKETSREPKKSPDPEERQVQVIDEIRKLLVESVGDRKATDIQIMRLIVDHRESIVKALTMIADAMPVTEKEEKGPRKWRFTTKRDKEGRIQTIDAVEIE